jgi:hypothetical protein
MLGASGPLVVALQYRDWMWAMDIVSFSVIVPLLILAAGYALWGAFGTRLPAGWGLGIAVVGGCVRRRH